VIELVAADIGGTHARFALATVADDGTIALGEPETLDTADHASFESAWEAFRARRGGALPHAASMAVAGPAGGEVIRLTNNPWEVRPALVKERLGLERMTVVNDFEAVAHAVARAAEDQFVHVCGPDKPLGSEGTISVLGPGTGLGAAQLRRSANGGYGVQATEGGHAGFAPLDSFEDALLAHLRARHGRVSVERVVSGPAIVDIHRTLAALEWRSGGEDDDVALWTLGLSGQDSLAAQAVERFCLALGSVAGDVALVQGAFAGVVIAGGLGYRIREALARSGFAERFRAKGRFTGLMAGIPVKLIVHPQPGLFGAVSAFVSEHS
jgi:glucokinase